jgi:hypothetical protein
VSEASGSISCADELGDPVRPARVEEFDLPDPFLELRLTRMAPIHYQPTGNRPYMDLRSHFDAGTGTRSRVSVRDSGIASSRPLPLRGC